MQLPDFLELEPYGSICLKGSRIGLEHLVYYYNEGYSAEMLLGEFPTLSLSLIHKTIAFYLDNKSEVDKYVTECDEEMERQRAASPPFPSLQELRERLSKLDKAKTS